MPIFARLQTKLVTTLIRLAHCSLNMATTKVRKLDSWFKLVGMNMSKLAEILVVMSDLPLGITTLIPKRFLISVRYYLNLVGASTTTMKEFK